ncbi:DUF2510 domain-containing protein [Mycolicibacterium thermoresistibile]
MDSSGTRVAGRLPDPCQTGHLRYVDGRQWTPEQRPATEPGDAVPESGFPLGERVLLLRPVPCPKDVDVACAVRNREGRELATGGRVGQLRRPIRGGGVW